MKDFADKSIEKMIIVEYIFKNLQVRSPFSSPDKRKHQTLTDNNSKDLANSFCLVLYCKRRLKSVPNGG